MVSHNQDSVNGLIFAPMTLAPPFPLFYFLFFYSYVFLSQYLATIKRGGPVAVVCKQKGSSFMHGPSWNHCIVCFL